MTLIYCLDDNLGMTFGGRRLSRDSAVCRDIACLAGGAAVCMDERSRMLFEDLDVNISEDGDIHFIEFEAPGTLPESAGTLVLYRWNRRYPADLHFDASLEGWHISETAEFPGTSHEKITKEVYIRENE